MIGTYLFTNLSFHPFIFSPILPYCELKFKHMFVINLPSSHTKLLCESPNNCPRRPNIFIVFYLVKYKKYHKATFIAATWHFFIKFILCIVSFPSLHFLLHQIIIYLIYLPHQRSVLRVFY